MTTPRCGYFQVLAESRSVEASCGLHDRTAGSQPVESRETSKHFTEVHFAFRAGIPTEPSVGGDLPSFATDTRETVGSLLGFLVHSIRGILTTLRCHIVKIARFGKQIRSHSSPFLMCFSPLNSPADGSYYDVKNVKIGYTVKW